MNSKRELKQSLAGRTATEDLGQTSAPDCYISVTLEDRVFRQGSFEEASVLNFNAGGNLLWITH